MSLKRAVKKQYYYCRMGSGGGSYLKIGLGLLEKAVWGVRQKLAETYHEKEKACQSKRVQILSAVSKMKEIQAELVRPTGWICIINGKKGGLLRRNMQSGRMN